MTGTRLGTGGYKMYELEVYNEGHYDLLACDSDLERLIINHRITIDKEPCRIIKTITVFNFPRRDET